MIRMLSVALALVALAGCGVPSTLTKAVPASQAVRAASQDLTAIQSRIRSGMAVNIHNYRVEAVSVDVAPTTDPDVYRFTAEQLVTAASVYNYYQVAGTYNRKTDKVAITTRTPIIKK